MFAGSGGDKLSKELDEQVAIEVMGWHKSQKSSRWLDSDGKETTYYYVDYGVHSCPYWSPSTSIIQAWEVMDKLTSQKYHVDIYAFNGTHSVSMHHADDIDSYVNPITDYVPGVSIMRAICLSALSVVRSKK